MTGLSLFDGPAAGSGLPSGFGVRGPRTFEEIPPGELSTASKHVFQEDHMTWGGDEHLRAKFSILRFEATDHASRDQITPDFGMAGRHLGGRPSEETDTAHHETTEN